LGPRNRVVGPSFPINAFVVDNNLIITVEKPAESDNRTKAKERNRDPTKPLFARLGRRAKQPGDPQSKTDES